jgi:hypothetical protein
MSFMDAREHGAKPGSGGVASAQQEASTGIALGSLRWQQLIASINHHLNAAEH